MWKIRLVISSFPQIYICALWDSVYRVYFGIQDLMTKFPLVDKSPMMQKDQNYKEFACLFFFLSELWIDTPGYIFKVYYRLFLYHVGSSVDATDSFMAHVESFKISSKY